MAGTLPSSKNLQSFHAKVGPTTIRRITAFPGSQFTNSAREQSTEDGSIS